MIQALYKQQDIHIYINIVLPHKVQHAKVIYNYNQADFDVFREALSMTPWETIFVSNYDYDEVWGKWISLFFHWVNGKICKQIGESSISGKW